MLPYILPIMTVLVHQFFVVVAILAIPDGETIITEVCFDTTYFVTSAGRLLMSKEDPVWGIGSILRSR